MNQSKIKGTQFETAVATYLRQWFPACERRALHGGYDRGDLINVPATIEIKATQRIDLAGALTEAEAASLRTGDPYYAAVIKRRRQPVSEAYAVMPLRLFAQLLEAAS